MRSVRSGAVSAAKTVVKKIGGEDAWKTTVKSAAAWLDYKRQRLREMGGWTAARAAVTAALSRVYEKRTGLVYAMTPEQLHPLEPRLVAGEQYEVHDNCVADLLLWTGSSPSTTSAITACASFTCSENSTLPNGAGPRPPSIGWSKGCAARV